ncbi:BQ5605_C004g02904 [Microbotryum silenes-dioicae]|uniref:BQ5605_C004g02904 protein n=1 Tax=Microbotryum silenes-dioicae TaxID=796604 RepID=A0A2X0N372_9BASI|nr:BQ5605_C004g02904 [Microbotryum silenes-dioicae]
MQQDDRRRAGGGGGGGGGGSRPSATSYTGNNQLSSTQPRNDYSQPSPSSRAHSGLMSPISGSSSSSSSSSSRIPQQPSSNDGTRRPSASDPRYRRDDSMLHSPYGPPSGNNMYPPQHGQGSSSASARSPRLPPLQYPHQHSGWSGDALGRTRANSNSPQSPSSRTFNSPTLLPGTSLWATKDLDEDLKRVNLDKCTSGEAIRETIFSRLEIADSDASRYEVRLTTVDGDAGRPISTDEIWDLWSSGRGKGRAIYLREYVPDRRGDDDDEIPVGMSAERLNQATRSKGGRENSHSGHPPGRASSPVATRPPHVSPAREHSPRGGQNEADHAQGSTSLRSDRPSWTWGPSQRSGHQRSSSSGNQLDTVSHAHNAPLDPRHDRSGDATPTPDEFGRANNSSSSAWAHSPPLGSSGSRFETFGGGGGGSGNHNAPSSRNPVPQVLSPAGGAPNAPSETLSSWSRTNTNTGGGSARAYQFQQSSHPPPPLHPMHPADARAVLPQYQPYVKAGRAPPSAPVFHNLALQQSNPPPPVHPTRPTPQSSQSSSTLLSPNQRQMMSKSVDNLRGQFNSSAPPGYPGAYGSMRSPAPVPPAPPILTSQPYRSSSSQPVPAQSPMPFNPRIMAQNSTPTPAASYYRSGLGSYTNSMPPPPLPPRGPYTTSSSIPPIGQVWPTPTRRMDRPSNSSANPTSPASNLPDLTRRLDLQPGQTLQAAGTRQRGASDAAPPSAVHMMSHDPSAPDPAQLAHRRASSSGLDLVDRDRYGSVPTPHRNSGSSSTTDSGASGRGNAPLKALKAKGQFQQLQHGRDSSSSSFASSTSSASNTSSSRWRGSNASPTHAMAGQDDGSRFGSNDDERPPFASPPSSARSSTSASVNGPLTPAQDNPPLDSGGVRTPSIPTVVLHSGQSPPLLDAFGDPVDEESATWFPVNQPAPKAPATKLTSEVASALRKQASAPSVRPAEMIDEQSETMREGEWAKEARKALLERLNIEDADAAGTMVRTDQNAASTGKDEFGDDVDEEGGTFMPGFGPARTATVDEQPARISPPGQVSYTLRDEPASRLSSPTVGTPTRRPNLRLEMPSEPASSCGVETATRLNQWSSGTSVSASVMSAAPPSSARRSAGPGSDGSGDVSTMLSSRRAERSEKLRHTSNKADRTISLNAPSPGMGSRRGSFRDRADDENLSWAVRPAVETVLENLDVYFPNVDLDKPAFAMPAPAPGTPSPGKETAPPAPATVSSSSSSSQASSQVTTASTAATSVASTAFSPAVRRALNNSGLMQRKSIRYVAQDRKRAMQKAGRTMATVVHGLGSSLLRRKSTKLFGARIEEVTGADLGRLSNTIREDVGEENPDNFSYKWIKGDLIGRGSYGHVYIGFSVTTGETIAVKQVELPKTQSDASNERTKSMVASLRGEIELLQDLDHPNIVLYLGMEQTPLHLSIFLEYVPGGSIGRIVRTHGKFEEDVIKFFTMQILEGLSYLHGLGILHRDMKADNILTDHDGMCKISDFGTSKKSSEFDLACVADIYNNDENMSMMQGSLFWMAPEVIYNMKTGYSAKADIWSFGCILIEMFAGRRPWSEDEQLQAMFKIATERRRPPIPSDVTLSSEADEFINNCLAINPDERPKAYELLRHPFLTLPETWSFTQSSLYSVMADEEQRRHAAATNASNH